MWPFPSFNHCCHRVTFVAINSKTSQVDKNPNFFMVYLYFYKKMKEFSRPVFFFFIVTDFPRFQGPVIAMYQSVWKCFRMHFRAISIYKISGGLGGPLTPRRFFGALLAPRPIRCHFRLVRTLLIV